MELACALNRRCGDRLTPDGEFEKYLGFCVDRGALESAISAPLQIVSNRPRYESVFDRGAGLTVHLAANHPFGDGNKRTALMVGLTYLRMNSIYVAEPEPPNSKTPAGEAGVSLMRYIVLNTHDLDMVVAHTSKVFQQWAEIDSRAKNYRGPNIRPTT